MDQQPKGAAVAATESGEYLLLETRLPGAGSEPVAVVLLDPLGDALHVKLRRDLPELLAGQEDDGITEEYFEALEADLFAWAREQGARTAFEHLSDKLSNSLAVSKRDRVLVSDWDRTLDRLYRQNIRAQVLPFRTHVPVYSVRAAAGKFGDRMEAEPEEWVETDARRKLTDDMFAAHVVGHSMEPRIPDGSLCLFRWGVAGSRTNRLVLIENYGETGENRYTIKRYRRSGAQVILEPLNPDYEAWEIDPEDPRIRVIAEFLDVL